MIQKRGVAMSKRKVEVGVTNRVWTKTMLPGKVITRSRAMIPAILIVTHFMMLAL